MKRGFTLVEILVATSILAIIFGIGLARYQAFNRRQVLNQAVLTLQSDLRLAQSLAFSGQKPSGWCSDDFLTGYRLRFDSSDSYLVEAVCNDESTSERKNVSLPKQVDGPSGENVLFKVLNQGTDADPSVVFSLTFDGVGSQQVTVSKTGEIE